VPKNKNMNNQEINNNQPTETTIPPIIEQPKSKTNWLIPIIFMILGIIIGIGGLLIFQSYVSNTHITEASPTPVAKEDSTVANTPDPTADWKTYSYQTYSIKFPTDWVTTNTKNPAQFLNYSMNSADGRSYDSSTDGNKLKVEIYQESTNDSLETYLTNEKESKGDGAWTTSKTTISGVEAIRVKTSNPGFVYYVKDVASNSVFSVAFLLDFDNNIDLANQILSTFKFN
jgi:hypothetical protein